MRWLSSQARYNLGEIWDNARIGVGGLLLMGILAIPYQLLRLAGAGDNPITLIASVFITWQILVLNSKRGK
jgi:hypothetical protein